jgi:thymidylate kinase
MNPQSGGAVVAFVGSEATGKSTLISEVGSWLGGHFAVDRVHAGKPASTALTAIPNALLPVLRAVLPSHRSTRVEALYASGNPSQKPKKGFSLIFGVRSLLLAHDRRSLLSRAYRQAANGTVVLCDRYPSLQSGVPDGPQLSHLPIPADGGSVRGWLARHEARLYREIPAPDLVIQLSAPLEVTVLRNAERDKTEPEDYVRRRHAQTSNFDFGQTPVFKIDTDQPVAETVRQVKEAIWEYL